MKQKQISIKFTLMLGVTLLVVTLFLGGCATMNDHPTTPNINRGTIRQDAGKQETIRISEEDAKNLALSQTGLTAEQVTFIKCNLEWEDGREYYDVEFYTQDGKEYDFDVNSASGEIIDYDIDIEY